MITLRIKLKRSCSSMALIAACVGARWAAEVLQRTALKNGADVNFRNPAKKDRTPLMEACMSLNEDLVKFLVASGADINKADADGWTSIHWITFKGHAKSLLLLLEKGGDWKRKSKSGSLPIDVALSLTSQKKLDVPKFLDSGTNTMDAQKEETSETRGLSMGVPLHSSYRSYRPHIP